MGGGVNITKEEMTFFSQNLCNALIPTRHEEKKPTLYEANESHEEENVLLKFVEINIIFLENDIII